MTCRRVVTVLALVLSFWTLISSAESPCLLRGQVLDLDGLPQAGVHIVAAGWAGAGEIPTLMTQGTESGDQGIFELSFPGEDVLAVWAEARGWATCSLLHPPKNRPITMKLQPGVTLRGALLDLSTLRPLAGGQVELLEYHPSGTIPEPLRALFRRRVVTGPDGGFEFHQVPEGLHILEARVPGFVPQKQGPFLVAGLPANPPLQVMKMEPGQPLRGQVLDPLGNPLEGADILVRDSEGEMSRMETDSHGSFQFIGPFPSPCEIQVKREGFISAGINWYPNKEKDREETLEIKLQPSSPVRLQLRDDQGTPIGGPVVWTFQCETKDCCGPPGIDWCVPFLHWRDTAAEDGTLVLTDLPKGRGTLVVQVSGFVDPPIEVPEQTGEQVRDLGTVTLSRGSAIQGLLIDDEGEPVPGAQVRMSCGLAGGGSPAGLHKSRLADTKSLPDGRFFVGGLKENMICQVTASASGYVSSSVNEVRAGTASADLVLFRNGHIHATVRDDMTDLPLAVFEAKGERSFHDPEGTLDLDNLEPGPHTISIGSPGYVTRSLDVEIKPGETADLGMVKLRRGVRVEGRVVDRETGTGVAGAEIGIVWGPGEFGDPDGDGRDWDPFLATTGPEGEFSLEGLVPGLYRISADAKGYVDFEESFRIQPGQDWALWHLAMDSGGVLSVRMEDQNGLPMRGCRIYAEGDATGFATQGVTDEQGRIRLSALPPGLFTVRSLRGCQVPDGETPVAWFWKGEVRRGETTEAVVRPQQRDVIVKGRVSRGEAGLQVHMVWKPAGESNGSPIPEMGLSSDQDGAYEGRLMAGGPYDVFFSWPPHDPERVEVSEFEGLQKDFEYPLPGSLQGRIVDARTGDGRPEIQITAQAFSGEPVPLEDSMGHWETPAEDGRFLIEEMLPGTYGLRVTGGQDYSLFLGPFEVEAGKSRDLGNIEVGNQPVCQLRVEDEADNSVSGAALFQVFDNKAWVQEARSTKSGWIRWAQVPGTNADLVLLREGYAPFWLTPLECSAGPITVTLETGEPVTLEVRDHQETPVPALTASVRDAADRTLARPLAARATDPSSIVLMTDEKGQLRLDSLAPGSYSAVFTQGDRIVATGRFHVRPGRTATSIFRIR